MDLGSQPSASVPNWETTADALKNFKVPWRFSFDNAVQADPSNAAVICINT
jgi:hypothetical protein